MPDDDLTLRQLCTHLKLSEKTVRRLVKDEGVLPRRDGTATKYTLRQVRRLEAALRKSPRSRRGRPATDRP